MENTAKPELKELLRTALELHEKRVDEKLKSYLEGDTSEDLAKELQAAIPVSFDSLRPKVRRVELRKQLYTDVSFKYKPQEGTILSNYSNVFNLGGDVLNPHGEIFDKNYPLEVQGELIGFANWNPEEAHDLLVVQYVCVLGELLLPNKTHVTREIEFIAYGR